MIIFMSVVAELEQEQARYTVTENKADLYRKKL
jgi:hypothetical protein